MRYEIRDISPPAGVRKAMELQAEAERRKRAQVTRLAICETLRIPISRPGLFWVYPWCNS
jgi:hypothetical protein